MPCHLAPGAERWRCRLWGAPRLPGAVRNLLGTLSGGWGLDDLHDFDVLVPDRKVDNGIQWISAVQYSRGRCSTPL